MSSDTAEAALHQALLGHPGWTANCPGVGAHRYYDDEWYCLMSPVPDGRWRGTVIHVKAEAGMLIQDIREADYFEEPAEALQWSDEQVECRR